MATSWWFVGSVCLCVCLYLFLSPLEKNPHRVFSWGMCPCRYPPNHPVLIAGSTPVSLPLFESAYRAVLARFPAVFRTE